VRLFRFLCRFVPSRRAVGGLAIGAVALGCSAILLGVTLVSAESEPCPEGGADRIGTPGPDLSAQLLALQRDGAFDPALVEALLAPQRERLKTLEVLVVPGFLTDLLEPLEAIGISDYLEAQVEALEPLVRKVSLVDLETEASVAENATTIAEAVAAAGGPLCLLSHSKGGLDALEFLLSANPALTSKVVCWVAIQAPFAGSPVADVVADWGILRWSSEQLLLLFGGSEQALHDQRTDQRSCYLAQHDAALKTLGERTSVLALAGAIDGDAGWTEHLTMVLPTLVWMRLNGIRNDGLVPTDSAKLPHLPFAVLAPLDHTGAVALGVTSLSFEQRKLLTQALLALALERR
jgi:hypothetical protein